MNPSDFKTLEDLKDLDLLEDNVENFLWVTKVKKTLESTEMGGTKRLIEKLVAWDQVNTWPGPMDNYSVEKYLDKSKVFEILKRAFEYSKKEVYVTVVSIEALNLIVEYDIQSPADDYDSRRSWTRISIDTLKTIENDTDYFKKLLEARSQAIVETATKFINDQNTQTIEKRRQQYETLKKEFEK